ncbi:MAG TPA: exodeoxyribonuclease VII large subunit [Clostridiales bacterium]|nr:exodeoxyribonuclease VII large subunit [Clostridiales bacterium]
MNNNTGRQMLTVTQLNEFIKILFDETKFFSNLYVRGEISNFKRHTTGHLYFTLKDEDSEIAAVMFRSDAARLKFIPQDGMKVIARCRVSVYLKRGAYQLYVSGMQPDGVGELYFAFEQLKRKLEEEGLFDPAGKRLLPRFPEKIGIITSPTGAAICDMINILGRRWPAAEVYIYPAQVQGAAAPGQLARGVGFFNTEFKVDVIIIGRGGGSIEDLWAFNNEALARAVAASEIPVISAVGHETDFTICDFAADKRASTPSAAAELAVPDRAELRDRLAVLQRRLDIVPTRMIDLRRRTVDRLATSRILSRPARLTDDKKLELDSHATALSDKMRQRLSSLKDKLGARTAQLEALSPLSVLSRGYAVVSKTAGASVKNIGQICAGDRVRIRLSDGVAGALIENTEKTEGV